MTKLKIIRSYHSMSLSKSRWVTSIPHMIYIYMYTYIRTYYNSSFALRPGFLTSYSLGVLLLCSSAGTYSRSITNDRKVDYKRQNEKVSMRILFTLRVFVSNLLRGTCRKQFFFFFSYFLNALCKPTH